MRLQRNVPTIKIYLFRICGRIEEICISLYNTANMYKIFLCLTKGNLNDYNEAYKARLEFLNCFIKNAQVVYVRSTTLVACFLYDSQFVLMQSLYSNYDPLATYLYYDSQLVLVQNQSSYQSISLLKLRFLLLVWLSSQLLQLCFLQFTLHASFG